MCRIQVTLKLVFCCGSSCFQQVRRRRRCSGIYSLLQTLVCLMAWTLITCTPREADQMSIQYVCVCVHGHTTG